MRRWSPSTTVTASVVAATLLGTIVVGMLQPSKTPNILDFLLPLVASAAMFLRRKHPVPVLIVVVLSTFLYYPYAHLDGPLMVLTVVALYTAADQGHLLAAIATGAAGLLAMGFGETGGIRHVDNTTFLIIAEGIVATIAAGGVTRNRRAYRQEVHERALDAERAHAEEARRRETEERLRIARELHDVVGHNISLINVQAGAALHGLKKRPEDAEVALKAIKEASKETLRQLRTTLGVLRQVDEEAPTAPAASLTRLDELIATTGLTVATDLPGSLDGLPAAVDLAATRIIKEALTNVSRHAGTDEAALTITRTPADLVIRIDDSGPGATFTDGTGYGVQGMRERATALGGTLEAGPRPEGGYRVVAHLPLKEIR